MSGYVATSNNTEDLAIYEDKDGDWGGGASTTTAPANPQEVRAGEEQDPPGDRLLLHGRGGPTRGCRRDGLAVGSASFS